MESHDQYYESADLLQKHESKVDWDDAARFYREAKALAKTDPEFAAWLEAHQEILS